MQVGSDGVQACATCHFRAGADPRKKNQIGPGLLRVAIKPGPVVPDPDFDFDGLGPNYRLHRMDFPFRQLADPTDRESSIVLVRNNVVSSQGVHHAIFGQEGRPGPDPDAFSVGQDRQKANVCRVEPRNTPTMINAVFNHRNFWGLRVQNLLNGVNPFGNRDANAFLYRADDPSNPRKTTVSLYMPCDSANHE